MAREMSGGSVPSSPPLLRDPVLYAVVVVALGACLPFFRYVASLGDEGVLLHGAVRLLDGDVLYRDVFGILPPGGYLIVTGWMKLFGASFASARTFVVVTIVGIAALTYLATRLASGNRPVAALVTITWVVLSQGGLTVANHHWITTVASMASALALLVGIEGSGRRGAALAAGLFAGAAGMVTSSRGALISVGVLAVLATLPGRSARLMSAMAGVTLVPTLMAVYVAATAGLSAGFDDVIRYPALHYTRIQAVPFGAGASTQHLALVALFPLAFVLAGVALARERFAMWCEPRFRISLALALVGFVGSYPRPDHVHIAFAAPLAGPLFALSAVKARGLGGVAIAVLLVGLCVGMIGPATTAVMISQASRVATARGEVVPGRDLRAGDFAVLVVQVDRIPAGDAVFFYPYSPLLPYLTGRRHPATVDLFAPGYTTAAHYRQTCARIATGVRWVVLDRLWSDARFLRMVFPALREPDPPEKREFEAAVRVAFDHVVYTSSRFELRTRLTEAPVTLCDGI